MGVFKKHVWRKVNAAQKMRGTVIFSCKNAQKYTIYLNVLRWLNEDCFTNTLAKNTRFLNKNSAPATTSAAAMQAQTLARLHKIRQRACSAAAAAAAAAARCLGKRRVKVLARHADVCLGDDLCQLCI
jgi:hypothetical protein